MWKVNEKSSNASSFHGRGGFQMVKYFVARWRRHILKLTASFAEYNSFVEAWNFEASPDLIVEIKGKG